MSLYFVSGVIRKIADKVRDRAGVEVLNLAASCTHQVVVVPPL
jgi:hypothetical protein